MPRIKDKRVIAGKLRIREAIRKEFEFYLNDGRTLDYTLGKLIDKYGYSESTLMQICKRQGIYADNN